MTTEPTSRAGLPLRGAVHDVQEGRDLRRHHDRELDRQHEGVAPERLHENGKDGVELRPRDVEPHEHKGGRQRQLLQVHPDPAGLASTSIPRLAR